jgi:ferrochelatase
MKGIILMAYGSPKSTDQVGEYFTSIRRGKRPSDAEIDELQRRYLSIGGISPLNDITGKQVSMLRESLKSHGSDTKVYVGMKHSSPFIEETAMQIANDGITELLCLPLAPFYSKIGTESYFKQLEESHIGANVKLKYVKSWHDEPELISYWSDSVSRAAKDCGVESELVFTAHSLPITDADNLETYKGQLSEASGLVSRKLGIDNWSLVFQSVGMSGGTWLGPVIYDHIKSRISSGSKNFVVAPIGFISDNLETLYDDGIRCSEIVHKSGGKVAIATSPNYSKELISCLYSISKRNGFA